MLFLPFHPFASENFPKLWAARLLRVELLGVDRQTKLDGLVKTESETHVQIGETYKAQTFFVFLQTSCTSTMQARNWKG